MKAPLPHRLLPAALAALLCACAPSQTPRSPDAPGYGQRPPPVPMGQLMRRAGGFYTDDGPDGPVPAGLATQPDATPRAEPLHPAANEPYAVFGRDYVPLHSGAGYRRQGTASWYGRKFHGQRTVSGEVYDMFAMTAAHPTLPIPSYARVTNLENNRSVVVRINDRGPFGSGRIMDVSYAAALKLGFAETALAPVEVEGIATEPGVTVASAPLVAAPPKPPAEPVNAATPAASAMRTAPLALRSTPVLTAREEPREEPALIVSASDRRGIFLQLGAFGSRDNAESFRQRLRRQLDWLADDLEVELRNGLNRVQVGPYSSRALANQSVERIRAAIDIRPVLIVR